MQQQQQQKIETIKAAQINYFEIMYKIYVFSIYSINKYVVMDKFWVVMHFCCYCVLGFMPVLRDFIKIIHNKYVYQAITA